MAELFNYLIKENKSFHFSLHPSIIDIRSILSINHNFNKIKIDVKYTAYINLEKVGSLENLIKSSRKVRSQEYNKAKKKFIFEKFNNLEEVNNLHKKTFERQNLKRGPGGDVLFDTILEKLNNLNLISMFCCMDKNRKIISSSIFIEYNDEAYYLIGASDPDYRNEGVSTATLFEHFGYLIKNKIKKIDLFGTNSPLRGDFKTSFGAEIQNYYEISFKNDI